MAPRMLPNRIGKVAPVLTLLLVALLSVPSDAATKKAAHWEPLRPLELEAFSAAFATTSAEAAT